MINEPIQGKTIWSLDHVPGRDRKRVELTSLIHFKEHWFCAFREGDVHGGHPTGRARILRSTDGETWETAVVFDWDCGDVRDPRLSITAEGMLMVNASIYFTSRNPRTDGEYFQAKTGGPPKQLGKNPDPATLEKHTPLFYQLDSPRVPQSDAESAVARQSVSWLSIDGVEWSSVFACSNGVNAWLWDVTWHNGMGYSVGKEKNGTLFRTRDGKNWRVLKEDLAPEGGCNETAIVFTEDDTCCLLRRHNAIGAFIGDGTATEIKIAKTPLSSI